MCVRVDHLGGLDLALLEVLVVLEVVVTGRVMVVWWAVVLLERSVVRSHANLVIDEVVEVEVGEDAIVRHAIVGTGWLEVMQVGESSTVSAAKPEWHVLVAVIDGVALLTLEEAQHVVLDDRVLMDATGVRASRLSADAVADSENILELVVLQGVAVDVDHAS